MVKIPWLLESNISHKVFSFLLPSFLFPSLSLTLCLFFPSFLSFFLPFFPPSLPPSLLPKICDQVTRHVGTSLVAQWLRIRLPTQGTWVRSLVREDPTRHGATKPVCHNYWACALGPASHNYWARAPQLLSPCALGPACRNYWPRVLQLLKPVCLEPMLCNKRSHHNEKPMHRNEE